MVVIKFARRFLPLILSGRKILTTRRRVYGKPGSVLEAQDEDGLSAGFSVRILEVREEDLGDVARRYFASEGFNEPAGFVAAWCDIYGGFFPAERVYVHRFEVVSEAEIQKAVHDAITKLKDEKAREIVANRLVDTLLAISGDTDSCGHSHGSVLHDIGKVVGLARGVLEGKDPHDVLREMGGDAPPKSGSAVVPPRMRCSWCLSFAMKYVDDGSMVECQKCRKRTDPYEAMRAADESQQCPRCGAVAHSYYDRCPEAFR